MDQSGSASDSQPPVNYLDRTDQWSQFGEHKDEKRSYSPQSPSPDIHYRWSHRQFEELLDYKDMKFTAGGEPHWSENFEKHSDWSSEDRKEMPKFKPQDPQSQNLGWDYHETEQVVATGLRWLRNHPPENILDQGNDSEYAGSSQRLRLARHRNALRRHRDTTRRHPKRHPKRHRPKHFKGNKKRNFKKQWPKRLKGTVIKVVTGQCKHPLEHLEMYGSMTLPHSTPNPSQVLVIQPDSVTYREHSASTAELKFSADTPVDEKQLPYLTVSGDWELKPSIGGADYCKKSSSTAEFKLPVDAPDDNDKKPGEKKLPCCWTASSDWELKPLTWNDQHRDAQAGGDQFGSLRDPSLYCGGGALVVVKPEENLDPFPVDISSEWFQG